MIIDNNNVNFLKLLRLQPPNPLVNYNLYVISLKLLHV